MVCGGTSDLHAPQKAGPKLTGRYICAPPHKGKLTDWIWRGIGGGAFIQEGHSAIFGFFALCLLLFLALLAGRCSDSTPDNYCCLFPLLCMFL